MEEEKKGDILPKADRVLLPGVVDLLGDGVRFMVRRYDLSLWYIATVFPALFLFGGLSVVVIAIGQSGNPIVAGFALAVLLAIFVISMIFVTLALTRAATAEGHAKFWSSIGWAKENFWAFLWVAALVSLVVTTGFVALIVPGIIVSVYLYFSQLSIIHHGYRGMAALRHSTYLVRENWWAVFGRTFAVVVVYFLISFILQAILYVLLGQTVGDILGTVVSFFGTVFLLRVMGRLYHELVAQKDDFDPAINYRPSQYYTLMAWGGLIITIVIPVVLGVYALTNWDQFVESVQREINGPDTDAQYQMDFTDMSEEEMNALLQSYEEQLQVEIDAALAE